ncbi:hypothetical protein WDU94_009785 [Cyamophila willieti]
MVHKISSGPSLVSVSAKTLIPTDNTNVPSIANSTKPQRIAQIMKYGFPSLDSVRSFDDFVLSYDKRNRTAYWVFEHLTKENTAYSESVNRSKSEFFEDGSIHEYFRKNPNGKKYVNYEVIGDNNVAVPTHFFKIIVAETDKGQLVMENYVMPNAAISDSTPLTSFMVPLDSIQRAAGFLFFEKLDKSKLLSVNNQKP